MITENQRGRSIVTLPKQTFGNTPVPEGTLVKDIEHSTLLARTKKTGKPGQVFFTTTLYKTATSLRAKDIYPLEGHGDIMYSDAEDLFNEYLATRGDGK